MLAQLGDAEQGQKTLPASNCVPSSEVQRDQRVVEDINDQASDFTAINVALSRQILQRLEDINTR